MFLNVTNNAMKKRFLNTKTYILHNKKKMFGLFYPEDTPLNLELSRCLINKTHEDEDVAIEDVFWSFCFGVSRRFFPKVSLRLLRVIFLMFCPNKGALGLMFVFQAV